MGKNNNKSKNNLFKFYIKKFFKFQSKKCSSFEELIKSRQELKFTYESNLQKLLNKKEKLWATNDISKWEIDYFNLNNNQYNQMLIFRDKNFLLVKCVRKKLFYLKIIINN